MHTSDPITRQYVAGSFAVALGLLGWVLPYRWNILRLRRLVGRLFPESFNQMVPKILGTLLILGGLAVVIATALGGSFE